MSGSFPISTAQFETLGIKSIQDTICGTVSKGQPYLVGERGAELFIPNSTGQIAQSARGMGSGQTTVNFNINTLDARGFDELLVRNRGTITQIINSAVNERGAKSLI
jgi:phage-related minor tail protein